MNTHPLEVHQPISPGQKWYEDWKKEIDAWYIRMAQERRDFELSFSIEDRLKMAQEWINIWIDLRAYCFDGCFFKMYDLPRLIDFMKERERWLRQPFQETTYLQSNGKPLTKSTSVHEPSSTFWLSYRRYNTYHMLPYNITEHKNPTATRALI